MGKIFMKETEVWFIIYTSDCVSRALRSGEEKGKGKCISHIAKNEKNEEPSFRVAQVGDKEDTLYGDDYKKETLIC